MRMFLRKDALEWTQVERSARATGQRWAWGRCAGGTGKRPGGRGRVRMTRVAGARNAGFKQRRAVIWGELIEPLTWRGS